MKISKQGWESSYYGKWLKAQERTRKKDKRGCSRILAQRTCEYCVEHKAIRHPHEYCTPCSLGRLNKAICVNQYRKYRAEISMTRTNWKRANELVDQIVEAIRQDGVEWGYLEENK
jgi:hypothetical protein